MGHDTYVSSKLAIRVLTDILNHYWLHNQIPQIWKPANIIPSFKPSKPPISLLSPQQAVSGTNTATVSIIKLTNNYLTPYEHGHSQKKKQTHSLYTQYNDEKDVLKKFQLLREWYELSISVTRTCNR